MRNFHIWDILPRPTYPRDSTYQCPNHDNLKQEQTNLQAHMALSPDPYHQQKRKTDECAQRAVPPYLVGHHPKQPRQYHGEDGHTMKSCSGRVA